jgi:hypothetical protein
MLICFLFCISSSETNRMLLRQTGNSKRGTRMVRLLQCIYMFFFACTLELPLPAMIHERRILKNASRFSIRCFIYFACVCAFFWGRRSSSQIRRETWCIQEIQKETWLVQATRRATSRRLFRLRPTSANAVRLPVQGLRS